MINVITVLASILLALSYVPQIVKIFQTESVEGISLSFWLILDLTLGCFVYLAIQSGDVRMLLMQSINLLLAMIVTMQVLKYKED